jgi:hypothetical protein
MTGARRKAPHSMFAKFIADCEEGISRQHLLISELQQQGLPTAGAKADLKKLKTSLRALENHAVVMRFLLEPSARTRRHG